MEGNLVHISVCGFDKNYKVISVYLLTRTLLIHFLKQKIIDREEGKKYFQNTSNSLTFPSVSSFRLLMGFENKTKIQSP